MSREFVAISVVYFNEKVQIVANWQREYCHKAISALYRLVHRKISKLFEINHFGFIS